MKLLAVAALAAALAAPAGGAAPSGWASLLERHLREGPDGVRRVRYARITPPEKQALSDYLLHIQSQDPAQLAAPAREAYWINLYNAQTVKAVLDHYPLRSILDIHIAGSSKRGPWDAKLLDVGSRALSLNDIENNILRKEWKDPRIHFLLNCASVGCPDLPPEPLDAANLERHKAEAARRFLASPRGAAFQGDTLVLSSIFEWYREDFGKSEREVVDWLAGLAPAGKAAKLKAHRGKIVYRYDWALNEAGP